MRCACCRRVPAGSLERAPQARNWLPRSSRSRRAAAICFRAKLDGYPLRFSDGDVLIFNSQGYFIDSLTSVTHSHFSINPGDASTSNTLSYDRHSFAKYCADHQPGGPNEVDPSHPNWHLNGTPHVDYWIVIFAINGHFANGSAQRPGAVSVHLDLR